MKTTAAASKAIALPADAGSISGTPLAEASDCTPITNRINEIILYTFGSPLEAIWGAKQPRKGTRGAVTNAARPYESAYLRRPRIRTATPASKAIALPADAGSISGTAAVASDWTPIANKVSAINLYTLVSAPFG